MYNPTSPFCLWGQSMFTSPDRLESVFIAASELPEVERSAFLEKACGSDAELRGAVERLLAAHALPAGIFSPLRPALSTTGPLTFQQDTGAILADRYKLLEQIGEGGMGAVWMARQTEPIKRSVAVKLIKPGMDSKLVLARFEAERQALALMDHANIARVYDAGVTSDGRPFFVMELVKGQPITHFCDSRRLTLKERLELFVPVCLAIQHAHQKGVIHRDIKPSNVLVAMYDDRPIPKVIDFGVAKAIGQPLTDQTLHTGFGTVIGTPLYMSPEQATFNNLDIDTRSDVYSLGALLYELMAGSPPFTRKELETAGLMEVLRVVREEEPPRPSTKLSTADALPTLAANRNTEPAKLAGILRSELDWIIMRALEKDRTRRYESANGLATDLKNYLSGEPVLAVPPSIGYRLRKFVRKRQGLVIATSIVMLALICAVAGATYGVIASANGKLTDLFRLQAERERDWEKRIKADQAQQGIAVALPLAADLLKQYRFREARVALDQAEALARSGAPNILPQIEQAQRDLALVVKLDDIRYRKWIWISEPGRNSRDGHYNSADAPPEYRKAFQESGLDLTALEPVDAANYIATSAIKTDLVAAIDDWSSFEPSVPLRDKLLEIARRGDPGPWTDRLRTPFVQSNIAALEKLAQEVQAASPPSSALCVLAGAMVRSGLSPLRLLSFARAQYPKDFELAFALGLYSQGDRSIGAYEAARAIRPESYAVWHNLGYALRRKGDLDAGIDALRRAMELKPTYFEAPNNLGIALEGKGDFNGAIKAYRKAIEIAPGYAPSYTQLGWVLRQKGELDEAIAYHKKSVEIDAKFALGFNDLGVAFEQKGNRPEAYKAYREAIRIDPKQAAALFHLADMLEFDGQLEESIAMFKQHVACDPKTVDGLIRLGNALERNDDLAGATAAFQQHVTIHPSSALGYQRLGFVLEKKGQIREAGESFREATRYDSKSFEAYFHLGRLHEKLGEVDRAITAFKKTVELKVDYVEAHRYLGDLYERKGEIDAAIASYQKLISYDSMSAVAHYKLGRMLARTSANQLATAEFERAIALDPKYTPTYGDLAEVQRKVGYPEDAIKTYRIGIDHNPQEKWFYTWLGWELRLTGHVDEAIKWHLEAIRIDPDFAHAYNDLGVAWEQKGETAKAIAAYREALRAEPKQVHALFHLGSLLGRDKERLDEAISLLQRHVAIAPNSFDGFNRLGQLLAGKKNYEQAIAAYREAARIDFKRADVLFHLGNTLADKGDIEEAIVMLKRYIELTPESFDGNMRLGLLLAVTNEHGGAIPFLRKATSIDSRRSSVLLHLGTSLCSSGEADEGIALLKEYVSFTPNSFLGFYRIGEFSEKKGDLDSAIAAYKAAARADPNRPEPQFLLGALLSRKGEIEEAVVQLKWYVARFPASAEGFNLLSELLAEKADLNDAIAPYNQMLKMTPKSAPVHSAYGRLLIEWADRAHSATAYRKSLEALNQLGIEYPTYSQYRINAAWIHTRLGDLLSSQGEKSEGMAEFHQAKVILEDLIAKQPDQRSYLAELSKVRTRLGEPVAVWRDEIPKAHIFNVSFSSDGTLFLAGGEMGSRSSVRIYNAHSGELVRKLVQHDGTGWSGGRFSRDGTKLVAWSTSSPNVFIWEIATGKLLFKLQGHKKDIVWAEFTPDGKRIISSGFDKTLRVWDASTGKQLASLEGHEKNCVGLYSHDGKWIVSYGLDSTIRVWDANSGKEVWKQNEESSSSIQMAQSPSCRCFSDDSSRVLSLSNTGGVSVLETASGRLVARIGCPSVIKGAVFINGGSRLATWAKDKKLRVFEVPSGKLINEVDLGSDLAEEPDNVTVSNDGRLMLTAHSKSTVKLHDLATGKVLTQYEIEPGTITRALTFSPDARLAAAGSYRGWVYLWKPSEAVEH